MLHWVVAGIGDIARKRVIPAILSEPRSRLYGVVTRDAAKGKQFAERVWNVLEGALQDKAVDAVYIATPVALHAPQAIAAIEAGKHVLCEKPCAMNYGEASEMVKRARECGKIFGAAYYRRTYPKVHRARKLIAQGAIGRPVLAEISCHDWFDAEDGRRSWLVEPEMAGGGPLYDIGSHRIDLLNFFFGEPVRVTGQLSSVVHSRRVEDAATVLIEYHGGVRGVVDVRWHCRQGRDEFRITGTGGVMDLTPLNGPFLKHGDVVERLPPHDNLHYPCVENFVSAVLDGAPLLASGESSIWTDWVTERAR
ncbi:MAG: Gfo/Idh/MocA family oxidoreductase [Acidobacteria bacterium]|nr:Gfo/Idh/MocA family oxidoreductase [Acidobacteriota bacterium]